MEKLHYRLHPDQLKELASHAVHHIEELGKELHDLSIDPVENLTQYRIRHKIPYEQKNIASLRFPDILSKAQIGEGWPNLLCFSISEDSRAFHRFSGIRQPPRTLSQSGHRQRPLPVCILLHLKQIRTLGFCDKLAYLLRCIQSKSIPDTLQPRKGRLHPTVFLSGRIETRWNSTYFSSFTQSLAKCIHRSAASLLQLNCFFNSRVKVS